MMIPIKNKKRVDDRYRFYARDKYTTEKNAS